MIRMQTAIVIAHRNMQPVFRPGSLPLRPSSWRAPTPPLTSGRETRKRTNARGVNFKVDPNTRPLPSRQSSALSGFTFLRLPTRFARTETTTGAERRGVSRPKLKRNSPRAHVTSRILGSFVLFVPSLRFFGRSVRNTNTHTHTHTCVCFLVEYAHQPSYPVSAS